MKVITMYLPQFHRTKENDTWWGTGFTDWVSVKNSKKLFEGHVQPHIPLNDNYYNLLDKDTMRWQSELMSKYGVDGVCFYHYWFDGNKKILEKPAESLLEWTDINIPFCFCWANETWARSWSNIQYSNPWSMNLEPAEKSGREVLLEQKYGEEADWEKHIKYLIPFFKDKRYIRIHNKPVLLVYKPDLIGELSRMVNKWKNVLLDEGIDGIYIIGLNCSLMHKSILDAILYHEPAHSLLQCDIKMQKSGLKTVTYDELWERIIRNHPNSEIKTYFGGVVSYDDTPRRGYNGIVILDKSAESFKNYLSVLLRKNEQAGNELTFINAWNEWGEGMYLEPDVENGYDYLNALVNAKSHYKQGDSLDYGTNYFYNNYFEKQYHIHKLNMDILDSMLELYERGKLLTNWLLDNKHESIAIYGYGVLGRHVSREIEKSAIKLEYIIDKNKNIITNYDVYSIGDSLPKVDLVIVCVPYYYDEVLDSLAYTGLDICSIQTILNDM